VQQKPDECEPDREPIQDGFLNRLGLKLSLKDVLPDIFYLHVRSSYRDGQWDRRMEKRDLSFLALSGKFGRPPVAPG
jgi:hypothetical protein